MRFKIFSRPVDLRAEPAIEPFPGHLPEDVPLRIDEGERRPAPDAEGLPEQVVVVDSNRVPDTGAGDRLPKIPGGRGGFKTRRMDPDDHHLRVLLHEAPEVRH